jgi:(p)ppGpp synthase/HD superfamily hydrolase
MICAAWLHDIVEDTDLSLSDIKTEFGDDVAHLVDGLTNVAKPDDGNRETRIAIDREHTSGTDSRTKTTKLADLIANLNGIVDQNSGFARKYLAEKELLLTVLREGDPILIDRLEQIMCSERKQLAELTEKQRREG